tara:strand:+ start:186 stop:806 length:621 start_codon:yes stop_codon:yes gene_type:complete
MKLKICGMKEEKNIKSIATLDPDYMGFIFWKDSPRNISIKIPELKKKIKKTGVFINSSIKQILKIIEEENLQAVQLHGDETPEFCSKLNKLESVEVIKVFNISNSFNFSKLKLFEDSCDFFLFDTKGKLPGGNGLVFDWSILKNYKYKKPFFLSGGIGIENIDELINMKNTSLPLYAIDVNSKFESQAGIKKLDLLKSFKRKLYEL